MPAALCAWICFWPTSRTYSLNHCSGTLKSYTVTSARKNSFSAWFGMNTAAASTISRMTCFRIKKLHGNYWRHQDLSAGKNLSIPHQLLKFGHGWCFTCPSQNPGLLIFLSAAPAPAASDALSAVPAPVKILGIWHASGWAQDGFSQFFINILDIMTSFLSFEEINNSLKDTQAKINNQK